MKKEKEQIKKAGWIPRLYGWQTRCSVWDPSAYASGWLKEGSPSL